MKNNAKEFLEEFCKKVSYDTVVESAGSGFLTIIPYLQAFEVWLDRNKKIDALGLEELPRCYFKFFCRGKELIDGVEVCNGKFCSGRVPTL